MKCWDMEGRLAEFRFDEVAYVWLNIGNGTIGVELADGRLLECVGLCYVHRYVGDLSGVYCAGMSGARGVVVPRRVVHEHLGDALLFELDDFERVLCALARGGDVHAEMLIEELAGVWSGLCDRTRLALLSLML